jgi:hypothetical protein
MAEDDDGDGEEAKLGVSGAGDADGLCSGDGLLWLTALGDKEGVETGCRAEAVTVMNGDVLRLNWLGTGGGLRRPPDVGELEAAEVEEEEDGSGADDAGSSEDGAGRSALAFCGEAGRWKGEGTGGMAVAEEGEAAVRLCSEGVLEVDLR